MYVLLYMSDVIFVAQELHVPAFNRQDALNQRRIAIWKDHSFQEETDEILQFEVRT